MNQHNGTFETASEDTDHAGHHKHRHAKHEAAGGVQQVIERLLAEHPGSIDEVKARVEREIRERPLVALGIASAVGFALGGGFRSRSGRKMIKRAVEYGMAQLNLEK